MAADHCRRRCCADDRCRRVHQTPSHRYHVGFIAVIALSSSSSDHGTDFPDLGMPRKDLLDIELLNREEIEHLLNNLPPSRSSSPSVKKVRRRRKSVLMLFYEPSTRNHFSFEVAAKRLSPMPRFDVGQSSITKGESVREIIETSRPCGPITSSSATRPPACPAPSRASPRPSSSTRRRCPRSSHPGLVGRLHHQGEVS